MYEARAVGDLGVDALDVLKTQVVSRQAQLLRVDSVVKAADGSIQEHDFYGAFRAQIQAESSS